MPGTKEMAEVLHKFPSTQHLVWLGPTRVREDKVMTAAEVEAFLDGPVVVEEKVDGANLGISFDAAGRTCFQSRGQWLTGKLSGQWEALRGWAAQHEGALGEFLPAGHVLFGEWCYAQHAIPYDRLPDWFLAFDVFDGTKGRFWSVERRDELLSLIGLATVPLVAAGCFIVPEILKLLNGQSAYSDSLREGVYLRRERGAWLELRAKLVRAEFAQAIGEHWSNKRLVTNAIQAGLKSYR